MAKKYPSISEKHREFILSQKIFFVATAGSEGRVNLSPKGMNSLRVLNENRVIWLNVTGSGNETSAHVAENPRMTLMFSAFEGSPKILRLYGTAEEISREDPKFGELSSMLPELPGARQIYDVKVDLVLNSCGMAIPFFEFGGERESLKEWAVKKGEEGVREYWAAKNRFSIDGKPTRFANSKE